MPSRPATSYYAPPPYPPPHVVHYQQPPARSGGVGRFFFYGFITLVILGMIGIGTLLGALLLFAVANDAFDDVASEFGEKTVTEKVIGGNRKADDKIAVITIDGIITGSADGFVAKQIRRVISDSNVKAVVLRVDSPGGTMSGSDYYHYLLQQMTSKRKIPVIVSMGSVAASGGYYVSMVSDEIYAEPTTITGSIGVIASLFDASELFQRIGVESNQIVSGQHKAMGSFMKPMSEEERAIFQRLIDDNFDRFKEIIRSGRREFANDPEKLDKLATGQVFSANEALAHKLIDKIGFIDEAIERAGSKAGLQERDYKVIQYKPKLSPMELLLESRSPNVLMNSKTLSEITTPKIYLLCPYVIPISGD
jgi:protease-4